jgi:mRNA-degrading endonuclease RelE of RelBE toxin-antitoxin system
VCKPSVIPIQTGWRAVPAAGEFGRWPDADSSRSANKDQRSNIGWRMEEMREDLRGDVLKLQAKANFYRLRVGSFRVLFLLAGDAIQVYAVKDRKEAYE